MFGNMGPKSEKLIFNFVLSFRKVTPFWLCLLETQVPLPCSNTYTMLCNKSVCSVHMIQGSIVIIEEEKIEVKNILTHPKICTVNLPKSKCAD